ncbi:MAG: ubiquitin-2 like Rad60 SUMO-like-domain-containing protein [Linnemannia gamsii]|nr:MAG: ubiquitin-2 like Rad60 SUMO-like-domain-containing protein [Linnemannia gamsii]
MSDSDDSKPVQKKPQPRPRSKRSKVLPSSSSTSATLTSPNSGLSSPRTDGTSRQGDNYSERVEDDFFNRSSVSFQQIHRMQETRLQEQMTIHDEDLESTDLKAPTDDVLPILDFEDDETTKKKTIGAVQKRGHAQETKRKRELSLTPPPELPTRRIPIHAPVPSNTVTTAIDLDEDDEYDKTNELDPELASIAAKLNAVASQQSMEAASPLSPTSSLSQPLANSTLSQSQSSQHSQSSPSIPTTSTATVTSSSSGNNMAGAATGSPQLPSSPSNFHTILLVIRMNRHPLLVVPPEYEEVMKLHERPVQITVRSNGMFREMMTFYCKQKEINYASTIFTYSGVRLMPSSTPAALDFPTQAIIEVYDQDAYKYIKDQEVLDRSRRLAEMERQAAVNAAAAAAASQEHQAQQQGGDTGTGDGAQQDDGEDNGSAEYIFIKLRGKDTSDEKIRVKKTTTVHAIISHYKTIKRIPASTTVKLEFDDEALDSTTVIGDTEVEDDDMLVVRVG